MISCNVFMINYLGFEYESVAITTMNSPWGCDLKAAEKEFGGELSDEARRKIFCKNYFAIWRSAVKNLRDVNQVTLGRQNSSRPSTTWFQS